MSESSKECKMNDKEEKDTIEYYTKRIHELEIENEKLKEQIKSLTNKPSKITGGRIPFGYTCPDGINLVEDEQQQKIIKQMKRFREHRYSYREISRQILKTYGYKISHTGVMKILSRNTEPKTKHIF